MAKSPKKQRLSVYLDPDVMQALVAYSARRDQSRSLIAEADLSGYGLVNAVTGHAQLVDDYDRSTDVGAGVNPLLFAGEVAVLRRPWPR